MNLVEQIFSSQKISRINQHLALKWRGGGWSYEKLLTQINLTSVSLAESGIRPGCRVVILCADTPDAVALLFAVLKIGGVAVFASSRVQHEELKRVMGESNASLLIYDSTTADTAHAIDESQLGQTKRLNINDLSLEIPDSAKAPATAVRTQTDEALWVYSSGSTSRPKAIVHSHRDLSKCSDFHSRILKIGPSQLIFCSSKLSFAYALANGLLMPLNLGATVYLYPDWMTVDAVIGVIQDESPSVVLSVPSVYRGMLKMMDASNQSDFLIPKHYVSAGEHLSEEIRFKWEKHTNRRIINAYGCSETLFLAFASGEAGTPPGSVGQLLRGVDAHLVIENRLLTDKSAQKGVLHLSHPFMFLHYANQQELTEKRLKDGNFVTGDLYNRDSDGNWFYHGRDDDLIKVSGQWVYLREIENAAFQFQFVVDAVVIGAKDNMGMFRPAVFFIASAENNENAVEELRRFLSEKLPKVKRPCWVRAVSEFPRTANGKINRLGLRMLVEGNKRD